MLAEPLSATTVVGVGIYLPVPIACRRLRSLGANVLRVQPPSGDPLESMAPAYYAALATDQEVVRWNLKDPGERTRLFEQLERADVLLTAYRPAALERLGLDAATLARTFPMLVQVSVVGDRRAPNDAGHDLTYQVEAGLVRDELPVVLVADLAGAEHTVQAVLAGLLLRQRTGRGNHQVVGLADAARAFSDPLTYGLTRPGGPLGGAVAGYGVYRCRSGAVAVGALESHFWDGVCALLGCEPTAGASDVARALAARDAAEWAALAQERGLPLLEVRQ